jgi:hemoglobin
MSTESGTLYERLGGEARIATIIDQFYDRVLADPELEPYFRETPLDTLRRMQTEFFGMALDGPQTYSGLSLSRAHFGRGITSRHFSQFVSHLIETLKEHGVTAKDINAVVARLSIHADDIIGGTTISD